MPVVGQVACIITAMERPYVLMAVPFFPYMASVGVYPHRSPGSGRVCSRAFAPELLTIMSIYDDLTEIAVDCPHAS